MPANNPVSGSSRKIPWGAIAIALAWLLLYHDVIRRLIADWGDDENYSHGFLIPFISGYSIWIDRKRLLETPPQPSLFAGGCLMLIALSMLFAGVMGAELYATRLSLALSLAALTIYFGGTNMLLRLFFPIGLLFFALPIPNIIFNQLAMPLQLLASDLATRAIKLFGVPALREGAIIELASMKLQVVEACSGIRSLVTLATLAAVYGRFYEKSWPRRIAIFLAVIPIAVIANAARVAGTGLMAHYYGPASAEGFMHNFSGWVVFLFAVMLLLALSGAFNLIELFVARRRPQSAAAERLRAE